MSLKCLLVLVTLAVVCGANSDSSCDGSDAEGVCVGRWSSLLEEWAISDNSDRAGRVMTLPANGYYITDRVDHPRTPTPLPLSGKPHPRPYTEWKEPSSKIVVRPPNKDKFKPSQPGPPVSPVHSNSEGIQRPAPHHPNLNPVQIYPLPVTPSHPGSQDLVHSSEATSPTSSVSPPKYPHQENHQPHIVSYPQYQFNRPVDRIDEPPKKHVTETDLYLLSAIEKLVYRVDLMEKRLRKMEESVHYFVAGREPEIEPCTGNFTRISGTCYHVSLHTQDWKSANLACRKLRAHLLEFTNEQEKMKLISGLLAANKLREIDWWTGGLNPGLLWIWSHSARQISNTNQTIFGEGRCLALVYDPAIKNYVYRGQDCALKHKYICQQEEDKEKLSNEIVRAAKAMKEGLLSIKSKKTKPTYIWSLASDEDSLSAFRESFEKNVSET